MHHVYDIRVVRNHSPERLGHPRGVIWIVDRVIRRWWDRSNTADVYICPMSKPLPWGKQLMQVEIGRCARIARAWSMHRLACDLAGLVHDCPALIVADRVDELGEGRLAAELRELYGDQPHVGLLIRPEYPTRRVSQQQLERLLRGALGG